MRKLRIGSLILFIVSATVFTGFKIYEKRSSDYIPPVISFGEEELVVSVEADEKELLKDVKAEDNKSGDVSSALVVEKFSNFTEEGERIITYAAIDGNGNVGRKERTLRYKDYKAPQFSLSGPLRYPKGQNANVLSGMTASSSLDGDLTDKIKYSYDNLNTSEPGKYPVEFRVMDSADNTTYLNTEVEVYDPAEEKINVELTEYLVSIDVNDSFDSKKYYKGADEEGILEIQSNVDRKTPGTYYVDYIVKSGEILGKSRLIVIVNEG